MFNMHDGKAKGRTLRRIWHLTGEGQPKLRSQWIVEATTVSTECRQDRAQRNQPVTEACDTETIAECA